MRRPYARLAAACAFAVAMVIFTGTAFAGGGNSANAPGQVKQAQTPAQPQAQQPTAQSTHSTSHATHSTSHGVNATSAGKKPSNTTAHNTSTHVGDTPDVSKRYGNGKTASQIAKSRGAGNDVTLTGPGNSQPHKVSVCGKHSVDVHAVKSYSSSSCAKTEEQPETPAVTTEDHKVTICHATGSATNPYVLITVDEHALKNGHTTAKGDIIPAPVGGCPTTAQAPAQLQQVQSVQVQSVQVQQAAPVAGALPATQGMPSSGVLGAQTTLAKPKAKAHHGVLGTVANVAGSNLPFTGFPLWIAVAIAAVLILAGLALRRRSFGARL